MSMKRETDSQKREFKDKEEFISWLRNRTKLFAIKTIHFCAGLPRNQATQVIGYRLIKNATSVAANYRAACRGRSRAEFFSKMCTVVEESDETVFWFEVIKEASMKVELSELEYLLSEATEIVALMTTVKKNTGSNLR